MYMFTPSLQVACLRPNNKRGKRRERRIIKRRVKRRDEKWNATEKEVSRNTRIRKEKERKAPKVRISLWKSEGYDILTLGTTHLFFMILLQI